MSQTPPSNQEPNFLGTFASIVGLLSAALFFTGWIYRWAYYGFFQLEITTLDYPFQSFLFVPLQVFLGSFSAFCRTVFAVIMTVILIQLTFWAIQFLGDKIKQNKVTNRRIVRSLSHFFSNIKFPRSLLNDIVVVIWILVVLFHLARWQGFTDARRDAIDKTSTLPVITLLVTADKNIALGRELNDLSNNPPLKDIRIIGDKGLFDQLRGRETNDLTDKNNPRVWRLLINRNNQFYVFPSLPKNAPANERPLVLSISEKQLVILSPEATKKQ